MRRQCATTAITVITAVRAASIMFVMPAMLGRLVAQLKMRRLDRLRMSRPLLPIHSRVPK